MKRIVCLGLVLFSMIAAEAQVTNIEHLEQFWTGYMNQTRFSKRWGMWADIQFRTKENYFDNLSVSILRPGLTYYLTDNTKLTLGYAYISHYPGDNHKWVTQPEHRVWQQVQWHNNYPRLRLMQWIRLEERYRRKIANDFALADGYNFNWRLRYNFFFNVPIGTRPFAANTFSFVLNDELHVNFGKQIVYNYYDQNRFFIGFHYHTTTRNSIQFGYMNLFQQLAAGNSYKNINAVRVLYLHNLDIRKK